MGRGEEEEGRQGQVDIEEDGAGDCELEMVDGTSSRSDLYTQGDDNAASVRGAVPNRSYSSAAYTVSPIQEETRTC